MASGAALKCGLDPLELYRTDDPHVLAAAEAVVTETIHILEEAHKQK